MYQTCKWLKIEKCSILAHLSHFNICWRLVLFRHHEIFCACFLFVIHSYLCKPDHGHHHFSYLSCFSETSKPQHTEMSQKQTRFTTAGVLCDWTSERTQIFVNVDLLYLCCTYEMPNTLLMSRLSCNRMETFIGTPVSCNTKFSMKTHYRCRSDWFHSGRECKRFASTPYL